MATVVNSQIYSVSRRATGFKVRFMFTLDDGRKETAGPFNIPTIVAAEAMMTGMVSYIESHVEEMDAGETVSNDSPISSKADAKQYLRQAMSEEDIIVAYKMLKKANDHITSKGWTNAQVKAQLNLTDDQWTAIVERYQYLNFHLPTILAFDALEDPRGDF